MNHLPALMLDLATILGVAAVVTLLFRRIGQPVVLGYILAGVIVGPHTPPVFSVTDIGGIETWAQLGVVFLLFDLGLHFSMRRLGSAILNSGVAAVFEVSLMTSLGYIAARLMNWTTTEALFLGCMLAVSSTTIVVKAFADLGVTGTRFAENVLGILLVEDLLAILMIAGLATMTLTGGLGVTTLAMEAGKFTLVIGAWLLLGLLFVPRYLKTVDRHGNEETLVVVSLGLCLSLAVMAAKFQYSAALGAFMMGSLISESAASRRIIQLMRPVRDLFGAVFFVSVGMLANPALVWREWPLIVGAAILVIFGKTLAVTLGSLASGQRLLTAVQSGMSLGQIGEFSFIIATLGQTTGAISDNLYPLIVAVSVVTTFTTPLLIRGSTPASERLAKALPERLLTRLERYARWSRDASPSKIDPRTLSLIIRWCANAIAVTLSFRVVTLFVRPTLADLPWNDLAISIASWAVALLASSPFLWGMQVAVPSIARRHRHADPSAPKPMELALAALNRALTAILVMSLSVGYFPRVWGALVCVVVAAAFYALFHHRLGTLYQWVENLYVAELEPARDRRHSLMPWDGRLTRLEVHPNAAATGRTLRELALGERCAISVVAIQRGDAMISPPGADDRVLPNDALLIAADDDGIAAARALVERSTIAATNVLTTESLTLTSIEVREGSRFAGTTLRACGLRERWGATVVGVEREARRILGPGADFALNVGDLVWIVIARESLAALRSETNS